MIKEVRLETQQIYNSDEKTRSKEKFTHITFIGNEWDRKLMTIKIGKCFKQVQYWPNGQTIP